MIMKKEDRAHFFSTYDMSIPFNLERADAFIKKYKKGWCVKDINSIIEMYNIWLFVENGVQKKEWDDETIDIINKKFKKEVVFFFAQLNRDTWTAYYRQIEVDYRHFFWDIIDRFSIDGLINEETLRSVFADDSWELRNLIKHERLVNKYELIITTLLKENESTAEWLLQEFVEEKTFQGHEQVYFPKSLSFKDREDIISRYLDSGRANLNYVRLIMLAKKDSNLRLSDTVRLKAIRLEKKLNEEVLTTGSTVHFKYTVSISGALDKPVKWVEKDEDENPILCYSKQVIKNCSDEDLIHYFRYVFEFLTPNGLIPFVSKVSESDVMERLIGIKGRYAYQTNMAFQYHEAISMLQVAAIQNVLSEEGRSIEKAIAVFYQQYLNKKYGFPSGSLSLAEDSADWITKCRSIVPEFDAIAKRYELYSQTGTVDEDLLRISSDRVRVTSVKSVNPVRYYVIKGQPDTLYRLFYLLFSDQCMLTFVEPYKNDRYRSFYQLLMAQDERVCYSNYHDYQQRDIDFLIEEGFLSKNENEMICVEKKAELGILKILYDYHCCPLNLYGGYGLEILKEMEHKGWLERDNYLLSPEERNYFEYYLYNSKYTNSRALRNRYAHGSNVDAEKVDIHRSAYYRLLILIILELLKIDDDLSMKMIDQNTKADKERKSKERFMIGTEATVGTYNTTLNNKEKAGEYLIVPKKFGLKEGYIYINSLFFESGQSYYIRPNDGFCAEYISFVMNSMLFRTIAAQASKGVATFTIEKIKAISLPLVPFKQQRLFAKLEHLIAKLMIKGDGRNRDENLQLSVFNSLRDYISLELFPGVLTDKNISFIAPFTDIMDQIDGTDMAKEIMDLLFAPGNVLMDNMKKARILLTEAKHG